MAYIIQVQSAAWYVKFADRIFGRPLSAGGDLRSQPRPAFRPALAVVGSEAEIMVPAFRRILYATDLSATARHAVRYACSLGNRYGAEVNVLHVVPDIVDAYASETGISFDAEARKKKREELNQKAVEEALRQIRERIHETSQNVLKEIPKCPLEKDKILVQVGQPAERIIATAQEGDYDLVIMGTHGHSKLDDLMLGSVARDVVHSCPVPVMVVRLPATEATPTHRHTADAGSPENPMPPDGQASQRRKALP
jgi:nucleotide-binding universal stress UspA family protein